jgi:hypothetical protein
LLKGGAARMATSALPDPMIWRKRSWITLCAFGTGASDHSEVVTMVEVDWGLPLEMPARESDNVTQRAATHPVPRLVDIM